MSGYMHRDPKTGDLVRLLRCDLCHVTEEETGVHEVIVEHPAHYLTSQLDLCTPCEDTGYDKAQALVADRHEVPIAEPMSRLQEPDQAEQRIEAERARWEAEPKHREDVA